MTAFLCSVSPDHRDNYQIGVLARKWGVEEKYRNRIKLTNPGDLLVFLCAGEIRSVHKIESPAFEEHTVLWPPRHGDVYPHRINISEPLFEGRLPSSEFANHISFMVGKGSWSGTIRGPSGVFNDKLTKADLDYLQSRLPQAKRVRKAADAKPRYKRSPEEAKTLFKILGDDVLQALREILPSIGLRRFNGRDFPAEYDIGQGGTVILCVDEASQDLVVVDFNRGEAPNETLLRLLQYMSWTRQTLANGKNVRGEILAESMDPALKLIISEVPNVSLRCYRFGIQLLDESTG